MSNQAGIWNLDGRPIPRETVERLESDLSLQGPDGGGRYDEAGFTMLLRSYFVTEEDALEMQPVRGSDGSVFTWDGRLDNSLEIISALGRSRQELKTDALVAAAALEKWGVDGLARLVGDWALTLWSARTQRLLLARDYIGMRKLYYLATDNSFRWSTDLAALMLNSDERYSLCDRYFAGFFAFNPEPDLTPYEEIRAVPPGGYVLLTPNRLQVGRYWSADSIGAIRYKADADYEEHFRQLFRQSVRRRLRSAYPLLADLSGGLDSSSIVCMAHDIVRTGVSNATINTISKYSLEEPGGDERPYFNAVAQHIGTDGTTIEICSDQTSAYEPLPDSYFAPLPGYFRDAYEEESLIVSSATDHPSRVHLCGLGGDELLGGVQDPVPILASHLSSFRLPALLKEVQAWALQRKTTVWSLLGKVSSSLMPVAMRAYGGRHDLLKIPTWMEQDFVKKYDVGRRHLRLTPGWRDWLPGLPSAESSCLTLAATLAGTLPRFTFAEQIALPYYDRDLFQFLIAIPEEQLLRPTQRRSLMRRSLRDIVPDVVLSRKTKWLGRRVPTLAVEATARALQPDAEVSELAARYVDQVAFRASIQELSQGATQPIVLLIRYISLVFLLEQLLSRSLLKNHAVGAVHKDVSVISTRTRVSA